MGQRADILTIQKFIYLLDGFHYKVFREYLVTIKAELPLKLAETIRQQLPGFDSHDQLLKKIYSGSGKSGKLSFNQLCSHTFKLSENLSNNYPEYLQPNIQKIQKLIADEETEEAGFRNTCLLEIAEKINDFPTRVFALKLMGQQSYLAKKSLVTQKTDARLKEAIDDQCLFYKIQSEFRSSVDNAIAPKSDTEVKNLQQHFESFSNHKCVSIRVLSQFVCLSIICDLTPQKFTEADTEKIKRIRKDMHNHPYVVFPFLTDMKGNLEHQLLNSAFTNVFAKETEKSYRQLAQHYDSVKFWKNYFNVGELHLIMVQATKLLSLYHYRVHLHDYQKIITPSDQVLMNNLIQKCRAILAKTDQGSGTPFEEISVRMLYSALLILSGGPKIKEGILELESLLTNYQQVNFKRSTTSIFLCLMVGYFSIKDYTKCSHTFKRYLKTIKGKLIFEGNNIKIHSYYYISQWLATHSKQYPAKLKAMLDADGNDGSQRTIWHLINHFNLPISPPEGTVLDLV